MKRIRSVLDRYRLMTSMPVSYRMSFALGFFAVLVAAALIGQVVPKAIKGRNAYT